MSHTQLRRLGFERLEDRLVYSAAVADLPLAPALPPAPAPAPAIALATVVGPPATGGNVSPAAGEGGQFEGRKTITYISGSFAADQAEAQSTFYVLQDTEFHFVLTAANWGAPSVSGVEMSIRDSTGQIVFSMSAAAGKTQAEEGYFDAGAFTAEFTRDAAGPRGVLRFQLGGVTLPLADTTEDPAETSASSTLAELSFYWLPPHSVSSGIVVQRPPASLALTSPDNSSAATMLDLLVSTPADAVVFPSSPANVAPATPPAAETPATGFSSAAAIPADSESVAVSAPLGISTSAPLPADEYPAAAGRHMAAAAPLPPKVPGRSSASPVGNNLLRALAVARTAAVAEQTVAATAVAEPLDAISVATPARESSPTADGAGLLRLWLAVVNENLSVTWTLAPVVVALGWCAWQARASRKHLGEAECDFPSVDFAARAFRRLAQ